MGRKYKKEYPGIENTVNDTIARACVNFAILYLEKKGEVPVSRSQLIKGLNPLLDSGEMSGLKLATKYSGKDKEIPLDEAEKVLTAAMFFKKRLYKLIGEAAVCKDI